MTTRSMPYQSVRLQSFVAWILAALWFALTASQGSRLYFLLNYSVLNLYPPRLELFGTNLLVLGFAGLIALSWGWQAASHQRPLGPLLTMALALLPAIPWALNLLAVTTFGGTFLEIVWVALWTGLSFGELMKSPHPPRPSDRERQVDAAIEARIWSSVVGLACVGCGAWWFAQSCWYYDNFLLGYNDFGHFAQRLSNTLSGHGWLIESPALPRFWDHFNPGLLLLLPCWSLWPAAHQTFMWQAVALAAGGWLIYRIALALRIERAAAALFGMAWLAQPTVGQMNLAYTYGWHPITFAIPLLLGTILSLLQGRRWSAAVFCLLAVSTEESVFVIVALTALCCGGWRWLVDRNWLQAATKAPTEKFIAALTSRSWLGIGFAAAVAFVLVYTFSGLGRFQTGRFVSLGSTTSEVILSPILRPAAFWGSLLRWDRWYYVVLLWIPCGLPSLVRGWFYTTPTLVPLVVLLVWNHIPAHSIAFQYASTLLPLFWLATLSGSVTQTGQPSATSSRRYAMIALTSGLVLSLFIGQFPFSATTMTDVEGHTYGVENPLRRRAEDEDGQWLQRHLEGIRADQAKCLATGRIAAHLINLPDVETVGQYLERRPQLAELSDRFGQPITHYDYILLDRRENFQQNATQTLQVEQEARQHGFRQIADQYDILLLAR